ncbi:MAG: hypothetical protein HOQ05_03305 [Corynebacteriales bacterium]|nr:hypothetical protein [Mycobacteriales bacterium]
MTISIGDRLVGPGERMFITAALGSVHNGNLDRARNAVAGLALAGADAVGVQFYGPDLMAKGTTASTRLALEHGLPDEEGNLQQYKEKNLMHPSWHAELRRKTEEAGVAYIVSLFGPNELEFLRDAFTRERDGQQGIKPDAIRLESLEHADPWLVADAATLAIEMDIPLIIETGMKSPFSVEQALAAARGAQVLLEDGIMLGPIAELAPEHVRSLAVQYGVLVGSFDRTDLARDDENTPQERALTALSAGAQGAASFNVQMRLDNSRKQERDGSVLPEELRQIIEHIRAIEAVDYQGFMPRAGAKRPVNQPAPTENKKLGNLRRTVIALTTQIAGTVVGRHTKGLRTVRASFGLPVGHMPAGRLRRELAPGEVIASQRNLDTTARAQSMPQPSSNGPTTTPRR